MFTSASSIREKHFSVNISWSCSWRISNGRMECLLSSKIKKDSFFTNIRPNLFFSLSFTHTYKPSLVPICTLIVIKLIHMLELQHICSLPLSLSFSISSVQFECLPSSITHSRISVISLSNSHLALLDPFTYCKLWFYNSVCVFLFPSVCLFIDW